LSQFVDEIMHQVQLYSYF